MIFPDLQQWGWDDAKPFSLEIKGGVLTADAILRHLPGKRLVLSGSWNGQATVAKLFFDDRKKAGQYEYALLKTLAKQGVEVPTAQALFEQGRHAVLLMQPVKGADLGALLEDAFDFALFERLLETLWKLYHAGWLQSDLHLGNFLLQENGEIVCLDAGAMKPALQKGDYSPLIDNLALMCSQAPLALQQDLIAQCMDFMVRHGVDVRRFGDLCRRTLHRRMAQAHRKWLRNCTAIRVESEKDSIFFSDRKEGSLELWKSYCRYPAALPLLKQGRRVSVYANESWVVKHYRGSGVKARLKQKLRGSRGAISWQQGWLWSLLGIPTPRPVMLAEFVRGDRAGHSVVVFPRIAGRPLSELMEQERQRAEFLADSVRWWLGSFQWAGISHGDMKAQNILVNETTGVSFIDLDGAGFSSMPSIIDARNRKDRKRFEKNWVQFSSLTAR